MIDRLPANASRAHKLGSGALALSVASSLSPEKQIVPMAALHSEGPTCPAFPAGTSWLLAPFPNQNQFPPLLSTHKGVVLT